MFCERCGKRHGNGEASNSGSLPLSKRLLKVVGVSASPPPAAADEPLLRFCLACRGYSCPECWNDDSGFCQTCVPLEEAVVELPTVDIPALDIPVVEHPHVHTPTPAMAFAEPLPETDNWLDARLESIAAMSVMAEAEPAAETESAVEPVAAIEAAEDEVDAVVEPVVESYEPVVVEAAVIAAAVEAAADVDAAAEADALVEAVEPAETFALDERPIELVFAEEEVVETEPEIAWDWDFVAETEAAPLAAGSAEPVVEPSEPAGLVEAPVIPARPEVLPPPVYHPLPPLGPIVPPPSPAAAGATPQLAFDVMEPPPAFVIAPPQAQVLMRPTLPAGLFDGPAPQIRPCHQCELPVSAKARFCRRCGSAPTTYLLARGQLRAYS